ncbi:uncharacterized protein [Notamacropus eugenii]|uniref:uncharacterized protein isoform X1 n=1 Tax=Notamacropus eugenii TaxID=9315 RepID=UPI003B67C0FE
MPRAPPKGLRTHKVTPGAPPHTQCPVPYTPWDTLSRDWVISIYYAPTVVRAGVPRKGPRPTEGSPRAAGRVPSPWVAHSPSRRACLAAPSPPRLSVRVTLTLPLGACSRGRRAVPGQRPRPGLASPARETVRSGRPPSQPSAWSSPHPHLRGTVVGRPAPRARPHSPLRAAAAAPAAPPGPALHARPGPDPAPGPLRSAPGSGRARLVLAAPADVEIHIPKPRPGPEPLRAHQLQGAYHKRAGISIRP